MDTLKDISGTLTSITALLAAALGLLQYFKTRREKIKMVRESFDAVVASLASSVEVERLAGAILLRRFFDTRSEVGIAGRPYWKEAVNVSTAILRGQKTGNFQKLLADGLAFAPNLEHADLQKTNLQFAYLGFRKQSDGSPETTNLCHADFYRADLSRASLKKADARGAVFYQAVMNDTVLTGANLEDAIFFEADLRDARFDDALLLNATFTGARNIPAAIAEALDAKGVYRSKERFKPPLHASAPAAIRVFVSKPGCMNVRQQQLVASLSALLRAEGMVPQTVDRGDYTPFSAVGEVQRVMGDCGGAVVCGFKQLEVREGTWRTGTAEEEQVKDMHLSTPWNHVETGMAVMQGLPIFVLSEPRVTGGIFDMTSGEPRFHYASIDDDPQGDSFRQAFTEWCADVRERSNERHDDPDGARLRINGVHRRGRWGHREKTARCS
jgi:uncharacterized protein YjbI with pentapeptide repeats